MTAHQDAAHSSLFQHLQFRERVCGVTERGRRGEENEGMEEDERAMRCSRKREREK